MSSGQRRRKHPFNKTVIKDGYIVHLRKDGSIKHIGDKYEPKHPELRKEQ
jgi:hypothetical protein